MAHTTKIKGAKGRGYTAHCLDYHAIHNPDRGE